MLQLIKTLVYIEVLLVLALLFFRWALRRDEQKLVNTKVFVLTLLTPAVGLLAGNVYLFFAYLACAVGFTSRNRSELCATYAMMLPMMPMLQQEASAGALYLVPLSSPFVMAVGALFGMLILPARRHFARPSLDFAVAALVLLFVYIDVRTGSFTNALRVLSIFVVQIGIPYLLVSRSISRREHLDLVLLRLTQGAVCCALVCAFTTVRHWVLYQSFYDGLHVPMPMGSATLSLRAGLLRTGGTFVDYTAAGVFLAVILMVVGYLRPHFRGRAFWAVVGLLLFGLAATQLRGAWIGAAIGFAYLLAYRGRWSRVAMLAGGLAATFGMLVVLSAGSDRLAEAIGVSGASSTTATYRQELLRRGLTQVAQHPLLGQTPEQLTANLEDMRQGQHIVDFVNSHLYIAMVAGLLGFGIWLSTWGAVVLRGWRFRKRGHGSANPAEIPGAIIVTSMVVLATTSIIDRNLTWSLLAVGMAGACYASAGARPQSETPARTRRLLVARKPRSERLPA